MATMILEVYVAVKHKNQLLITYVNDRSLTMDTILCYNYSEYFTAESELVSTYKKKKWNERTSLLTKRKTGDDDKNLCQR